MTVKEKMKNLARLTLGLSFCAIRLLAQQTAPQNVPGRPVSTQPPESQRPLHDNKVRLFITDDPLFETYAFSHSSAGFYANTYGAGGAAHSADFAANPNGKADPRTVELQADMQKSCPQFTVTSKIENADYVLWFRRNDQHRTKMLLLLGATGGLISAVQKVNGASLFGANGDMVYATREKTVGSTVKDVCKHVPNPTQALVTSQRITDNAPPVPADSTPAPTTSSAPGVLIVNSTPGGAEIYLDDDFVGNTPSTVNVQTGKHSISVKKAGFQDWVRYTAFSGGSVTLNAELSPGSTQPSAQPAKKGYTVTGLAASGDSRGQGTDREDSPGWIGVETKRFLGGGVQVVSVWTDGPASKVGLKLGDIITELNGVNVSQGDFEGQIAHYKPGSTIRVGYMRNAWAFETKLTVSRMPM